jgi:virginiamycin B lyase
VVEKKGFAGLSAVVLALLMLAAALSHAPSAHAAVYWGNGGAIGAANLDGRLRMHGYFRPDYPTYGQIGAVAVSSDYLYWGGTFGIGRVPLYGPEIAETLVRTVPTTGALPVVNGLALDGSHIYWTTSSDDSIGRANLDGSDQSPQFISGIEDPCGVAVDGSFIYWGGVLAIGRARLDGSGVEKGFVPTTGSFHSCGVAVDSEHLYWGDAGGPAIRRAPLGGGGGEAMAEGVGSVSALAVDAGHLYWTADTEGVAPQAAIGRLGLAGGSVEPNWLVTNLENAVYGVAVDSLPSPPPLPPKSKPVEIASVKHDRRRGAVLVDVQVPVAGKLRALAPSFAWKILGKKSRGAEVPPGKWRIKLWPGRGTLSQPLRTRLLNRGRASVKLTLSLREFGKDPATTEKKVRFIRARR